MLFALFIGGAGSSLRHGAIRAAGGDPRAYRAPCATGPTLKYINWHTCAEARRNADILAAALAADPPFLMLSRAKHGGGPVRR